MVESQHIQPTVKQLSINVLVKISGIIFICQYSAVHIYNVHTCKFFFIIKVYFPNLDWMGHEIFFVD